MWYDSVDLPEDSAPYISVTRARDSADAERLVEQQGAGRDGGNMRLPAVFPKPHDRILAEVPVYLA